MPLGGSRCVGVSPLSSITAGLCQPCQSDIEGEVGTLAHSSRQKEVECCECGKLERSCPMALKVRDTHRSNTWGTISLRGLWTISIRISQNVLYNADCWAKWVRISADGALEWGFEQTSWVILMHLRVWEPLPGTCPISSVSFLFSC